MSTRVKICGLKTADMLDVCLNERADFVGFVHFGPSPRHLELAAIKLLIERARGKVKTVVLTVDADDALISEIKSLGPDYIQLHGEETPARAAHVRRSFGLKTIKALGVANGEDVKKAMDYEADILLLDAKPAPTDLHPGGNGRQFDWGLLETAPILRPFMLSGGLTPDTIREAILSVNPGMVDVSSGVERQKGVKDGQLIKDFIKNARLADEMHASSST